VPAGAALAEVVDALIDRRLIVNAARAKGLAVEEEEITHAAALLAQAFGPGAVSGAAFRRYLAEDLLVSEYIDLYLYPRVRKDDDAVRAWFVSRGHLFIKQAPRDRAAREAVFPKFRNEALYHYLRDEITRLLKEEAAAARRNTPVESFAAGGGR